MSELFTTTEGAWGDGSVRLTMIGVVVTIVVILALVIASAIIRQHKEEKKNRITTKQLVFSAAAMGLAMVCSLIKFANLPMGGSVTLFSMLFIVLIGYWYGPYVGIMAGFAYGLSRKPLQVRSWPLTIHCHLQRLVWPDSFVIRSGACRSDMLSE